MHQTKKRNQWYFGMEAHTGVDDESDLAWRVWHGRKFWTDVAQASKLLPSDKKVIYANAGYTSVAKRSAHEVSR